MCRLKIMKKENEQLKLTLAAPMIIRSHAPFSVFKAFLVIMIMPSLAEIRVAR